MKALAKEVGAIYARDLFVEEFAWKRGDELSVR
jgi:hypothetical protein